MKTTLKQLHKTINEVLDVEAADQDIVTKAAAYAEKQHAGQKRKFSNEPYFVHPERVANTVKKFVNDKNIIAAAYLHDTVEDTDTSLDDIDQLFNSEVADYVRELTSKTLSGDKTSYLITKLSLMSDQALLIKLADRLDNVTSIIHTGAPKDFAAKYWKETKTILQQVGKSRRWTTDQNTLIDRIMDTLNVIQTKFKLT